MEEKLGTPFIRKLSQKIFNGIWWVAQKISPNAATHLLYWAISDKAFDPSKADDPILKVKVLGKTFPNPIGVSGGLDKEVQLIDELIKIGYGFGEFGTFTLERDSSPSKAYFIRSRQAILLDSESIPNPGIRHVAARLVARRRLSNIVGISITSTMGMDDIKMRNDFFVRLEQDLIQILQTISPYCDYVVLNLSNSVMPVGQLINNPSQMTEILRNMKIQIQKLAPILTPRLLVKIPCDIDLDVKLLAASFLDGWVDGLIIAGYSNSPVLRQTVPGKDHIKGYLTGRPLHEPSTMLVKKFYQESNGRLTIIASGGVFTGEDAFRKIAAGASLVQINTAILYHGPEVVKKIKRDLAKILKIKGFKSMQEAIGDDHRAKI